LPDLFGVEEQHYIHGYEATLKLLGCAAFFIFATAVVVCYKETYQKYGRFAKRCCSITQATFAMSFAWCVLYACQYEEGKLLSREAPWTITERMILAGVLSFLAFAVILLLHEIQELVGADNHAKEVYYQLIMSLALLVGFSWEQCFDRAVEVVAMVSGHEELTTVLLAFVVAIIVTTPWRRYILSYVVELEEGLFPEEQEEEKEKTKKKKRKEHAADTGSIQQKGEKHRITGMNDKAMRSL
jgi:hypothetical protein